VHSLLLGMMDEGRLTDGLGRQADFRNAIIVMTSNVGSRCISNKRFLGLRIVKDEMPSADEMRRAIYADLADTFAPEFRNRFDEILVFNALGHKELRRIAQVMLSRLPMRVEATPGALGLLVKHGFDPAMGARPLRRTIDDLVREPLSNELLKGSVREDDTVRLRATGKKLSFEVKPREAPRAPDGIGTL
jgi:ATP-dependent Clp protease ATP-binding subunit ClpC